MSQLATCPTCDKAPQFWKEKPAFASKEIFWLGCELHGHLAGGFTPAKAVENWNLFVEMYNRAQGR